MVTKNAFGLLTEIPQSAKPEVQKRQVTLDGSPNDIGWIRATMLFPNNDVARRQCFAVEFAIAKVLGCEDADRLEIAARDLRLLIDAPAYADLKRIAVANTKRAIVAGDILMGLYVMHRFKVPEPSMNKAKFVAMEYAKTAKYGDGTRMNVSERMILDCWNEYKSVAHFWAAFRINRAYPYAPDEDVFISKEFPEVAVEMYRFGVGFVPFRAKAPILDAEESWALPTHIPGRSLVSEQIPERLLKYLKKYKAPKSSA